jgi:hypothetical protein
VKLGNFHAAQLHGPRRPEIPQEINAAFQADQAQNITKDIGHCLPFLCGIMGYVDWFMFSAIS